MKPSLKINYSCDYDEKNFCFKIPNKQKTFEDLYNSYKLDKEKSFTNSGVEYVFYDGCYYPFEDPGSIKFIFPDNSEHDIFIPRNGCLSYILKQYQDNKYVVKIKGEKEFKEEKINMTRKYSEIKFLIKEIKESDYLLANEFIDFDTGKINLSELSTVFNLYFDNKVILNSNPIFKYTNERKEFFDFLINEIGENSLIPICGPEGIGKTISIMAFCKKYRHLYGYIYCNLRKLIYLYNSNNHTEIKKIIIQELLHSNSTIENLNRNMKNLEDIFSLKLHPIDLIARIIKLLDLNQDIIVLDQYKIKYDYDYLKLQNLLAETESNGIKVIVISSMNELDVKQSIIDNIGKKMIISNNAKTFSLNYIYISSLVYCDKDEIQNLDEEEKEILQSYQNNYQIFYEILKLKESYEHENKNEGFGDYCDEIMKRNFFSRVDDYFNNENKDKNMEAKLFYLVKLTKQSISIKDFLNNSSNIPFRFFIFNYKNKNIFKISDINLDDSITLVYQFQKYLHYLAIMYNQVRISVPTGGNEKNQKAINFEQSFADYLLIKEDFIKDVKVIYKVNIKNFFNIQKEDFKLDKLEKEKAIVFIPMDQNAKGFDCGLLRCIDKENKKFYLYLFQATRKKDLHERLSFLTLNDYLYYIKLLFENVLGIKIEEVFFAYVFDFNNQDTVSINHCSDNDFDYIIFDEKKQVIFNKYKFKPYRPKIKILNFKEKNLNFSANNYKFSEIEKSTSGELKDSLKFISRKRKIINKIHQITKEEKKKTNNNIQTHDKSIKSKDTIKKSEVEGDMDDNDKKNIFLFDNIEKNINDIQKRFDIVKKYLTDVHFLNKNDEINNDQKEKIIDDYLLENSAINFPGISYSTENQKNFLSVLKGIFSENQLKKLLNIIKLKDDDFIIQFEKIKLNLLNLLYSKFVPEYKTHIIIKSKEQGYYIDYKTKKLISLDNGKIIKFYQFPQITEFYTISFATIKKNNDILINFMKENKK